MFTGIIESLGEIVELRNEGSNLHLSIRSAISSALKIDQSVSHNGVCLTVVDVDGDTHTVTAVDETLQRSNLGAIAVGDLVNLERCVLMNGRLDGHIVQGHVDTTPKLSACVEQQGSWLLTFSFNAQFDKYIVEKGIISINGISLTRCARSPGRSSRSTTSTTPISMARRGDRSPSSPTRSTRR